MKGNRAIQDYVMDDSIFRYALILSLFIHLAVFAKLSYPHIRNIAKPFQNIEVTYYNLKLQTSKVDDLSKKAERAKEDLNKNTAVLLEKRPNGESMVKDMSKLIDKFTVSNKQPAMIMELHVKRKISVPALKSEKINNPLYQNYYQAVRSMIRERAYANYSKLDTGEVYLTFVVLSNGTIKQVQLIDERTSANEYLKGISLKSIQESNPFPPFPKDLSYPELSFNVVISFEVEE